MATTIRKPSPKKNLRRYGKRQAMVPYPKPKGSFRETDLKTSAVKAAIPAGAIGKAIAKVYVGSSKGTKIAVVFDVKAVRKATGLSQEELARITGFKSRSISGWERGRKPGAPARIKLLEIKRLFAALKAILPEQELTDWLSLPNPAFDGNTPSQIIERGESDRIWRMIHQIDAGVAN